MDEVIGEPRKMQAFEVLKSTIRSYTRSFPAIFSRSRGSVTLTEYGRKAIDFLSGAGALNYGHNNHEIDADITEYFASNAMVHGLDMAIPEKLGSHGDVQLSHTSRAVSALPIPILRADRC